MPTKKQGWFGIDLDGTLAIYDGWQGADHIGEPVPAMLAQVKDLIAKDETVKIFTARVGARTGDSKDPNDTATSQRKLIQDWCEKHGLPRLEVTAEKDFSMVALYDDRAIQVIANTGEPIVEKAGRGLAAAEELYFNLAGCQLTGAALIAAEKLRELLGIDPEFKFANIPAAPVEPESKLILPGKTITPVHRSIRR